ncbi:MAG: hypothetical protein AAGD09_11640 [Cyanobacteria bacterium P01_F01_bin.56]
MQLGAIANSRRRDSQKHQSYCKTKQFGVAVAMASIFQIDRTDAKAPSISQNWGRLKPISLERVIN